MKIRIVILFALLAFTKQSFSQKTWMLGPMLHLNIGNEKMKVSWGIEVSYWNYDHFPYSFDWAFEFEKRRIRLYTEVQTGVGFAGLSAGPLVEFRIDEGKIKAGFQGSVWGNYFLGFDLRYRYTGGNSYFCPGAYLKIPPKAFTAPDSNSSSNHHSDWD